MRTCVSNSDTAVRVTERQGTHVVREDVQRAVVRVRLLREAVPEVVLRDEVARARVQAAREEARHDQVDERAHAEGRDERVVERELEGDVVEVPCGEALGAHETGAQGVEEDLEGAVCG